MTLGVANAPADPVQAAHYICVPLAVFRLHQARGVDLYVWPEGENEPTLYCGADMLLTERDLEKLAERGCRALHLSRAGYAKLSGDLESSLGEILSDESTPPESRIAVLQSAVALEADAAFHAVDCDRFISLSQEYAGHINSLLQEHDVVPRTLFQILRHDFYTFTHISNVATYAAVLATRMGLTDRDEIERITVGGLLHDLGKKWIPASILCKPGKLNEEEWDVIRSHPQRGYEELCGRDDLNEGQLMMVYSHHERIDGKGYPVGLLGDDIHPWARLLAVVDVFDALTGTRPYRSAWKAGDALAYLERNAGTQFDSEIVQCWISALKQR
jgi:HD-GYP domain-containing protein (c-di-GMP phosphodiesterase class II)